MSESPNENTNTNSDFIDPLGVNEYAQPADTNASDGVDNLEQECASSQCSSDIDAIIAQHIGYMSMSDADNGTKELQIIIDNPEKHSTTLETYITFRVTCKVSKSRSDLEEQEFQVRRRYNDFLWLQQRLQEEHPVAFVPPLPEKHSLKRFERFSPDFVRMRMMALQSYLQRICDHPVLSFDKNLILFLSAKQAEFHAVKKEGSGLMSRLADSFHNMSASYMVKSRPTEFVNMGEYVQSFGEKLGSIDRISQRVLKEQYEYLNDLNELGPVFTLWSNSEDRLCLSLAIFAKSIEKNFIELQTTMTAMEASFSNQLREYQLYVDVIKGVLCRRDAIQMEYEITLEEANRKKDELGPVVGTLHDKSVCADSEVKSEMERWHQSKKKDFRKVFIQMAKGYVTYYTQCMKAWEDAIPLIQRSDNQASPQNKSV